MAELVLNVNSSGNTYPWSLRNLSKTFASPGVIDLDTMGLSKSLAELKRPEFIPRINPEQSSKFVLESLNSSKMAVTGSLQPWKQWVDETTANISRRPALETYFLPDDGKMDRVVVLIFQKEGRTSRTVGGFLVVKLRWDQYELLTPRQLPISAS